MVILALLMAACHVYPLAEEFEKNGRIIPEDRLVEFTGRGGAVMARMLDGSIR
jgi:hypothetical protein